MQANLSMTTTIPEHLPSVGGNLRSYEEKKTEQRKKRLSAQAASKKTVLLPHLQEALRNPPREPQTRTRVFVEIRKSGERPPDCLIC